MSTRRRLLQYSASAAGLALPTVRSVVRGAARESLRKVTPFGAAVVISGSARERGRVYGRRFGAGIREFFDREILSAFVGKPAMKEDLLHYAGACMKVIKAECPIIADELEGMADYGVAWQEYRFADLNRPAAPQRSAK